MNNQNDDFKRIIDRLLIEYYFPVAFFLLIPMKMEGNEERNDAKEAGNTFLSCYSMIFCRFLLIEKQDESILRVS